MADERIGLGDRIRSFPGGARIDAQDLGEERGEVLPRTVRVTLRATVAGARVQQAVGAELELAAIVVRLPRVRDHDYRAARALRRQRVGRGPKLVDLDVPATVRVVGVEAVVALVVGIEGDRQQALLVSEFVIRSLMSRKAGDAARRRARPGPGRSARPRTGPVVAGRLGDVDGLVEFADPLKANAPLPVAGGQLPLVSVGLAGRRRRRCGARGAASASASHEYHHAEDQDGKRGRQPGRKPRMGPTLLANLQGRLRSAAGRDVPLAVDARLRRLGRRS